MPSSARDPSRSLKAILSEITVRQPLVVLDGQPLSGVTRTMQECIRETHSGSKIITESPAALVAATYAKFFDGLSPYENYVVWLDDLSPAELVLLEPEVLDVITVYATVVANITTAWCHRILNDTSPLTAGARTVLNERAHRVTLPFELTHEKRRRAQAMYPDVTIGVSLAESLVGGDVLLTHFANGSSDCPVGQHLVQAATNVRRAGVHRPLNPTELRSLLERSLTASRPGLRPSSVTDDVFTQAMDWAARPPAGAAVGLLARRGAGWTALNYLADRQDDVNSRHHEPIPFSQWVAMIEVLRGEDAFNIGVAAHLKGLPGIADAAFQAALRSRDAVIAGTAMTARKRISGT